MLITESQAKRAIQSHPAHRDSLVAPGFTADLPHRWAGRLAKKPWDYLVTVLIPHIAACPTPSLTLSPTPSLANAGERERVGVGERPRSSGPTAALPEIIQLHRLQTEPPYIMIIDTGSPRDCHEALERLRAADVEIHYIRAHGYQHPSSPVCAALDLGFALCRTPFLFCTHNDVFPRRRDLLHAFVRVCEASQPVVGYQMSPRQGDGWRGVVSHTATMVHMPTMRRLGPTWSLESYWDYLGYRPPQKHGWPDTEQPFDLCLKRAGIKPKLIGAETNTLRHLDQNIDHARSSTGLKLYPLRDLANKADRVMASALADARERIRDWSCQLSAVSRQPAD